MSQRTLKMGVKNHGPERTVCALGARTSLLLFQASFTRILVERFGGTPRQVQGLRTELSRGQLCPAGTQSSQAQAVGRGSGGARE